MNSDVIKRLNDCRRYLEDKQWSDKHACDYVDSLIYAIEFIKGQEAAIKILANDVMKNNCNDCGRKDCGHRPRWGETVRSNCFMFEQRNYKR